MPTEPTVSDRAAWLQGPATHCANPPVHPPPAWRIVLLGAPGVGKGTQAELLGLRLRACHLSTGDVFRSAKTAAACGCEPSPAMRQALEYMKRGELVPDATVLGIIRERVACLACGGGFLLDGFPRTVAQAEALSQILHEQRLGLDAVVDYRLPIEQIVERLSGRRTCSRCKAVYHLTGRPPKSSGVCDHCGGELIQREDDRPEAIRIRMDAYNRSTAPLTDYYAKRDLLVPVTADGSPEEILERTLRALEVAT